MDNLVSSFTDTLFEQEGQLREGDYLRIIRKLRHNLVDFVTCCIACNITPRINVTVRTENEKLTINYLKNFFLCLLFYVVYFMYIYLKSYSYIL